MPMDYLQNLESQMAALQRKIRLLQDLRFFVETASPDELAGFGEELRSVVTSSGTSLSAALAGLLGQSGVPAARIAAPIAASAAPPSAPRSPPRRFTAIFEPLIILVMGVVVGALILSMLIAITSINQMAE